MDSLQRYQLSTLAEVPPTVTVKIKPDDFGYSQLWLIAGSWMAVCSYYESPGEACIKAADRWQQARFAAVCAEDILKAVKEAK